MSDASTMSDVSRSPRPSARSRRVQQRRHHPLPSDPAAESGEEAAEADPGSDSEGSDASHSSSSSYGFGEELAAPAVRLAEAANRELRRANGRVGAAVGEGGADAAGAAALDGGPAHGVTRREDPNSYDLLILVECAEDLQKGADATARRGVTVSIGMDKNTKISMLFRRFAEFASDLCPSEPLSCEQLEFAHTNILPACETAEGCALMKNDRIRVRRRSSRRGTAARRRALQARLDTAYFAQLSAGLLSDVGRCDGADVAFECGGGGTCIRGHSAALMRRCGWLAKKIGTARERRRHLEIRQPVNTIEDDASIDCCPLPAPDANIDADAGPSFIDTARMRVSPVPADDHSGTRPLPRPLFPSRRDDQGPMLIVVADDDEDDADGSDGAPEPSPVSGVMPSGASSQAAPNPESPIIPCSSDAGALLRVPLRGYPPEAVRILLEYCYTNRCASLGRDALEVATLRDDDDAEAQPPPDDAEDPPTISMDTALSAVSLAEDASLPRLALMCEVAASHLVRPENVLSALAACTSQGAATSNHLPLLRRRGVEYLMRPPMLQQLHYRLVQMEGGGVDLVVPAIWEGTRESLGGGSGATRDGGGNKRKFDSILCAPVYFKDCDDEDRENRSAERKKWRTGMPATTKMSTRSRCSLQSVESSSRSSIHTALGTARRRHNLEMDYYLETSPARSAGASRRANEYTR